MASVVPLGDRSFNGFSLQVRRGSLLSQPQSVLQKLASISETNPLAPRNSRGFLFQTLSPAKAAAVNTPNKTVSSLFSSII